MTCNDLANWVNEVLDLEGDDKYCEGRIDVATIVQGTIVQGDSCPRDF